MYVRGGLSALIDSFLLTTGEPGPLLPFPGIEPAGKGTAVRAEEAKLVPTNRE